MARIGTSGWSWREHAVPAPGLPTAQRFSTYVANLLEPDRWIERISGAWDELDAGSCSDDDLRWWADRIREWEQAGHEVFGYFNNDGHGHAVRNARTLRHQLGN